MLIGWTGYYVYISNYARQRYDFSPFEVSMFMGALGGLFLLGITTTRANAMGAFIGLFAGVGVMIWIWKNTDTNGFLYSTIGLFSCLIVGYVVSVFLPGSSKNLDNLTLHTQSKEADVVI